MKRLLTLIICITAGIGFAWAAPPDAGSPPGQVPSGPAVQEVDLGVISPGKITHSQFRLKRAAKQKPWMMEEPQGWESTDQEKLSGSAPGGPENLVVALKFDSLKEAEEPGGLSTPSAFVRMVVFTPAGQAAKYSRVLPLGKQRIPLSFTAADGMDQVWINFELLEKNMPVLNVHPRQIDLAAVDSGKMQHTQLLITNKGTEKLHWRVSAAGGVPGSGRFISFQNEALRGKGGAFVPPRLDGLLQLVGNWKEDEGYPSSADPGSALTFNFTGNGAVLIVRKDPRAGSVQIFFDDVLVAEAQCRSEKSERWEVLLAEKKAEGEHRIKIVSLNGCVAVEGVRIYSNEILTLPPGWVKISPDAGDTTGETDYVNLRVAADKLEPGLYVGKIRVQSDGGEAFIDVSFRVVPSNTPKILGVYKYARGFDHLFTSSPEREDQKVLRYYRRQGLAFRLFKENTPGTRPLHRWYHPGKGDHYYSSEPDRGNKLHGYIHEGPIGNIASSRLPATRELYCWYNPKTGLHFFTLDLKGEGYAQKGYKYEGIVGYVK